METEVPSRAQRNGLIDQVVIRVVASVAVVAAASLSILAAAMATEVTTVRVATLIVALLAAVGLLVAVWMGRGPVIGPFCVLAVVAVAGVFGVGEREVLTGALLGWVLVVCATTVDAATTRRTTLASTAPSWVGSVGRLLLSATVAAAGGLVVVVATAGGAGGRGPGQVSFAWIAAGAVSVTLLFGLTWWSLSRP